MPRTPWRSLRAPLVAALLAAPILYCGGGDKSQSTEPQMPAPPSDLRAQPSAAPAVSAAASAPSIGLAWTDNARNETGFRIERCTGAACSAYTEIASVGANVTAYADPGLEYSTAYSYRVRASNGAGSSGYSNIASAATAGPPLQAPAAPSGLSATAISPTQIDLSWTDASSNESAFSIDRCSGPSCTGFAEIARNAADDETYSDAALTPGTSYSYRVRAHNAAGASGYAGVASATTPTPSDLVVSSLGHSPASPTTADALTFTAVIRNDGGFAAGASTAELRIGGETAGAAGTRFSVPALGPGETFSIERQMKLPAGGYTNTATADITAAVTESNETNNVRTDAYTVVQAQADLVISAPATLAVTPQLVVPGGSITLSAWTVRNQGSAASTDFSSGFYLSTDAVITAADVRLDQNHNFALAAGASADWGAPKLAIPASTPPGNYYIGILVDYANETSESNEGNNYKSTPLAVGLALRYTFDGDLKNSSALAGYDGTSSGATFQTGKFGQAIRFDGTTTTGATLTGTRNVFVAGSKWTISLWYKEDALQVDAFLFALRNGAAGWETYHGVSSAALHTCSNAGCTNFTSPSAGVWHNLIFRYDAPSTTQGGPLQIYVDGALRSTIANTSAIPMLTNVIDIRLGNSPYTERKPSVFYIDELRVYNMVFTEAEQCTALIGGTWSTGVCTPR